MSDKWKSKITKKIKTLEAGQNLALAPPIKIRFQQLKDGSVLDTKTGQQWKIYPVKDMTAGTVLSKVKTLNEGGFSDWRLPSRADLASLSGEMVPAKTPGEQAPVVKTCCAWVAEPNSEDVDWKFYIEEDNDLWASSKETPDNRVVIVRTYTTAATPAAVAPAAVKPIEPAAPATSPQTVVAPIGAHDQAKTADNEKKVQSAKAAPPAPAVPAKKKEPVLPAVEPVKSGTSETLYFDLGSSKLPAEELVKLKSFYSKIKADKGTIVIDGHSDASASKKASAANLILSLERSSNVAIALNKMGLGEQTKLEIRAVGDGKPVGSNETPEGRKLNRRVVVSFMPE
jgi:outer membrane protein OmpA-like peptidoglycan-associated protein